MQLKGVLVRGQAWRVRVMVRVSPEWIRFPGCNSNWRCWVGESEPSGKDSPPPAAGLLTTLSRLHILSDFIWTAGWRRSASPPAPRLRRWHFFGTDRPRGARSEKVLTSQVKAFKDPHGNDVKNKSVEMRRKCFFVLEVSSSSYFGSITSN